MGEPLDVSMPDNMDIGPNYTVRVTAIDPNTGALISGVTVNTVLLTVQPVTGSADDLQTGQWFLVPGPNA